MATWNGSRFISQQLESLFRQTFQNFRLIVRDDNSSDSTLQIVHEFRSRYSDRLIIRENASQEGACRTFSLLAEEVQASYFAFCDQDDLWRPEKLEVQLAAAKEIEAKHGRHVPVLVFTDLELIGPDNHLLVPSLWHMKNIDPHRATLGAMLVQNLVNGCTTFGNRSLLLLGVPIPEQAIMHDFWLGLVAAAFGVLVPLDETLVGYRQHDRNAVGAGSGLRITDAVKRLLHDPGFEQGIEESQRQAAKFAERYANHLSAQQVQILKTWYTSNELPAGIRHWNLYRTGLRRTRFLNNLGFLVRV